MGVRADLLVSEDDDAGGDHGVGQEGPDGHEVHQDIQIKHGRHHSWEDNELN